MIENEIEAFIGGDTDRVSLLGPEVTLNPQAFTAIALVLHELVTNSVKYGSFSSSEGQIAISWSVEDTGALVLNWRESGGPTVTPPERRGFGSTIIERTIPFDLQGEADIDYAPLGVTARFVIPAHFITVLDPQTGIVDSGDHRKPVPALADEDATVLLVEDNIIIALDAEDLLRQAGFTEVLTVSSVATALDVLEQQSPSVAVLDINLGNETSIPIAEALQKAGIPFLFASGYGDSSFVVEKFPGVQIITKPYSSRSLHVIMERLRLGTSSNS